MIDHNTVTRIMDTAQIVDVVSDFVSLKKRGVNYLGLCPFHNEKTPSFTVSPAKGIFKCFGCGEAGNAVSFIMKHEGLSFPEALKHLAEKYHIEVSETELSQEQKDKKNERDNLGIVTSYAQKYFTKILQHHKDGIAIGMSYLKERGFREPVIDKFQLGYCLNQRDAFTKDALKNAYKLNFLVKSGLTIKKDEDILYDRFWGRVIFPIHSLSGRVVAFGGRTLRNDKKTAKYLNSPESELYHKSDHLYGIFFAKKTIVQTDKCYLVEGYTDVLAFHQAGIENVVASSGTSLTVNQIRLISRFSKNLTIVYDGDEAGIKASMRGIDLILEQEMNVRVVLLPDGEDPDSFAKARNSSQLIEFLDSNEKDFVAFKAGLLTKETNNDPVKRANAISDIVRSIAIIPDPIIRSEYIKQCSQILDVKEEILHLQTAKIKQKRNYKELARQKYKQENTPRQSQDTQKQNVDPNTCEYIEREVIRLLLNYGTQPFDTIQDEFGNQKVITVARFIVDEIKRDELELSHPVYSQVFNEFLSFFANQNNNEDATLDEKYFINHRDKEISALSIHLLTSIYELSKFWKRGDNIVETEEIDFKTGIPKVVLDFKGKKVEELLKETQMKIKNAASNDDIQQLMTQYMEYKNLNMQLAKQLGERIITAI